VVGRHPAGIYFVSSGQRSQLRPGPCRDRLGHSRQTSSQERWRERLRASPVLVDELERWRYVLLPGTGRAAGVHRTRPGQQIGRDPLPWHGRSDTASPEAAITDYDPTADLCVDAATRLWRISCRACAS
jgi:hypothetical protein